ncbi:MAG: pyruvate carboxylase subunit B, partial [Myxococcota bacterium]|nr:pyruvate carboxylase subunit B [Myxococcota bacterium]
FMGEVLINGNPEVAGRPAVTRAPLTTLPILPADGVTLSSRDRLRRDGPKALADWVVDQKQLLLTDTTFRDAHQSLLATRMRTVDLIAPLPAYECGLKQLFSLEVWGGATFDVAYRFLKEDPWQRLRQMRQAAPSHLLQMLLRASNAVGYTNYPDNVVKEFVRLAYANGEGIDVFRVFDSLNWVENMRVAMDAVLDAGGICEAALCYSGDLLSPDEDVYTLSYYVRMAKQLEAAGAHILAIKDMAGVCKPAAAVRLVTALKNEVGLPIHLHTHDTSGGAVATVIAAAGAGVDIVDGAMDALSGKTSQPNLGTVIEMLRGLERDPDVPRKALDEIVRYWEAARKHYAAFETELKGGMSSVYQHAMPGGQYTNLKVQARALGIEHRWPEVVQRYADVNQLFGNIVKVTPSSKVVGDMALFMVSQGLSVDDVMSPEREVAFPASVVKFFRGELGQPVGGFPAALQAKVLRGAEAITVRPGSLLPPADFHAERQAIAQALGTIIEHISDEDVCASLLYPKVFASFAQHRAEFGDTSILPTPTFFYGAQPGEEINVQIDAGKRLILRYLGESPTNDMKGRRSIFFELNGTPRVVVVRDKNATGAAAERPIATGAPGEVAAPMPGTVVSVAVSEGQSVSKGEVLITLEAMKMESTMYAEQGGTIRAIHVAPGDAIDVKDLLLEMDLA